jgi:UDP-glucose:(heptosyl)LPS alpha-1,3-glucosyltransferase
MRIALVVERFEERGGGVEGVAWQVAHGLAAAGEDVRVIARRASPGARVPVERVDLGVASAWQPARVLAFSRAAASVAPRGRFEVVHSFSRTVSQDVYRAGGGSHADYMQRAYGPLGRRLRRLSPRHAVLLSIEARVFSDPSQIVQCNSEMVRRELARRYGLTEARSVVIPNGVDLERFHPRRRAAEGAALRTSLVPGDAPLLVFAGSGFHRKGLDTALRALAASKRGDAVLAVAGRDEARPWRRLAVELGVADRVRFLGPRGDLEVLFAAGDALVLPTRYDAFANVCLEAAAAGLVVVTSGANGAAELLRADAIAVEDPEDVAGFASALDRACEPDTRERLGTAARRVAEAHGWPAHVAALRALYARISG